MTTEDKLEKVKKLADDMYYAAANLGSNVGSGERLRKTMEEYHKFIIHEYNKEEPVSEELEKVVEEIVDPTVLNAYGVKEIANRLRRTMIDPVSEDNTLRKASEEYLKVLSETPYNNTPITNAQTIVRELITFLDNPSKYNPNHIEEPVSEGLEEAAERYATEGDEISGLQIIEVEKDAFIAGAKWQKERDNIPQELVDAYWEFQKVGGNAVRDFINAVNGYNSNKSINEDLEEAADNCYYRNHAMARESFIEGANWQKQQFEKNRLKHCNSITNEQAELEQGFIDQHLDKYNRMPTYLDAIEYGMRLQKQQMMKDAVDVYIRRNRHSKKNVLQGLDVTCNEIQRFKDRDKLKLIFFKED